MHYLRVEISKVLVESFWKSTRPQKKQAWNKAFLVGDDRVMQNSQLQNEGFLRIKSAISYKY